MDHRSGVIATVARPVVPAPDPLAALEALRTLPFPLLLDGAAQHDGQGRYSYLMADPVTVFRGNATAPPDLFRAARDRMAQHRPARVDGIPPFQGGLAGYFGYEFGARFERLPATAAAAPATPDILLGLYDTVIAWDHAQQSAWLITAELGGSRTASARADTVLQLLHGAAATRELASNAAPPLASMSNFSRAEYENAVERVREYILAGDVFQVNLSQRFTVATTDDPLRIYKRLRVLSPASHAAFFDAGDHQVLSASPERFLRLEGEMLETRPIKGTRRRESDDDADRRAIDDLMSSEKDRAENVMIVDLMRNDLSRVTKPGTVEVTELAVLESHPTVHHLVSTVRGRLAASRDAFDVVAATFPGGSITGAPKVRAMEIIAELEGVRRGVYCGSLGYLAASGDMELSIAIRTIVLADGIAYAAAGGAIVADSDPGAEYDETLAKADALLRALGT